MSRIILVRRWPRMAGFGKRGSAGNISFLDWHAVTHVWPPKMSQLILVRRWPRTAGFGGKRWAGQSFSQSLTQTLLRVASISLGSPPLGPLGSRSCFPNRVEKSGFFIRRQTWHSIQVLCVIKRKSISSGFIQCRGRVVFLSSVTCLSCSYLSANQNPVRGKKTWFPLSGKIRIWSLLVYLATILSPRERECTPVRFTRCQCVSQHLNSLLARNWFVLFLSELPSYLCFDFAFTRVDPIFLSGTRGREHFIPGNLCQGLNLSVRGEA